MTDTSSLYFGKPRFKDNDLAAIATREGYFAAWRLAFARYGTQAPQHVANDFAVALNTPSGGTFLAVDRFAIQTLCYRVDGDRLRFASRADELGATELDLQAIFDYFYFHTVPSPRTIFKDVLRLPPGHYALFENGQLTVGPYWRPRFSEGCGEPFSSLRDEFLHLVQDAVASRIEEGRTGCYLSGGTDSSTVAGMITKITGEPAETFSIGFDVSGYDEMEYARIAARHFGTNHHEYYVTPDDLVRGMPQVARSYDQPFGNSSAVPAYYCARMAKQEGIDKLLAGDGGDELFGGNTRYAKQRVFGIYDHIPEALRRGLIEPALADSGLFDHIPLLKKGASYVRQARVPMPDRMQTYNLLMRMGLDQLFTADFLARIDATEPERHQREVYATSPARASLINKMLAYDWRYTLAENDLPKVIGSARLADIGVGFPFLDDRLLEFSLALPTSYKLKGLKLRWFFKEALRGFLPDEIIAKKKHGFGLPFGPWAVTHTALNKLATDSLLDLAARGLVRAEFVRALLKEHMPAYPGFYGELVWIMTMLEQWLKHHAPGFSILDGSSKASNRITTTPVNRPPSAPTKPPHRCEEPSTEGPGSAVLSDAERRRILVDWNDTAAPYQADQCIHELIEARVEQTPTAIAVAFKEIQLTYRELNDRANRLAHHLRALGVRPEVLVPIYLDRGPDMVVAILAILKAGGAYVPIDATYPRERLTAIVAEASASIMVTHESLVADAVPSVAHIVCLDRDAPAIATASSENPLRLGTGKNLAFALFTSGSTGKPKGVLVTHSNLVNYRLLWERECALSTSISGICQMTFFSFAVFQGDVVRALCSGKKLVLCPRETLLSPRALYAMMKREATDFAEFVPALLRSLIGYLKESGDKLDFMRVVVVGADRWYLREHQEARQHMGENTRFIHVYGSSETTLDSTRFERSELVLSGDQPTPIGRPFTNVRAYILDANLQPVRPGEEGELCIGGAGVARGYLNLPELTAEKFLPDPFTEVAGARLFRTGDLAKWLPDGNIAFLGRRDHQVKIRGFRIELGEIESALERHPAIETGLVQAVEREPGEPQLVAYCVPRRAPAADRDPRRRR